MRTRRLQYETVGIVLRTPVLSAAQAEHGGAIDLAGTPGVPLSPLTECSLHCIGVGAAASPELDGTDAAGTLAHGVRRMRVRGICGARVVPPQDI